MTNPGCFIFDLDGTLVESYDFDSQCYIDAVRDVLGQVAIKDWGAYLHVTDAGILHQIMEEHGIGNRLIVAGQVREAFGLRVRRYLAAGGPCNPIPGATAALDYLRKRGCKVGIATGGWNHTAIMKLDRAGIAYETLTLATSDDAVERVRIMKTCLHRLNGENGNTVYVGDGLWDLKASMELGWSFVGVGQKLQNHCSTWVPDLLSPPWTSPQ